MKDNVSVNKFTRVYLAGFFIISALPLLTLPPYFFPADFGKTIVFRSIIAILLCLFVFQLLFKRRGINLPNIKKNPIIWALGGLFGVFFLASIFSVNPYFSFWSWPIRGGGFITFAGYGVLALLSFILLTASNWKKVWDFSIFTGMLVSLIAVAQYYSLFSNIFLPSPSRPSSTMGNPNLLAMYLLLLLFLTLSFAIKEKEIWKKTFYSVALALFSYAILITESRAAYLGILCGLVYFFLWYPAHAKTRILKISVIALLAMVAGAVLYVNLINQYPPALKNNRFFTSVTARLSAQKLLEDTRFSALRIEFDMIKTRPVLGYGPENFSIGFDNHYKPDATDLAGLVAWWDRAHNIIIQNISDAGILGLIAYLALFMVLFWQLFKAKTLVSHGICATLIGYFIANLFSFDSFGSYLIFFLLAGYSLHLTSPLLSEAVNSPRGINGELTASKSRNYILTGILFFIGAIFLWHYNLVPLQINAQINKAQILAQQKNCQEAFVLMEKVMAKKSFLDSYARLEYVDIAKTCADFYPQNSLIYKKRGLELISQAVKIQPLYTRYWIFMAGAANDLASAETDENAKNTLIKEAYSYLDKALEIAPKHQEIPIGRAKVAITAKDYPVAEQYARDCIALNPDLGECYFYLGLVQIYAKNNIESAKSLQTAKKSYSVDLKENLQQLANAYGSVEDYQNLVVVYEKLISQDFNVPQYHSSLAYFYSKLGNYDKARQEALQVLELSPESKPNVEAFLKTLP